MQFLDAKQCTVLGAQEILLKTEMLLGSYLDFIFKQTRQMQVHVDSRPTHFRLKPQVHKHNTMIMQENILSLAPSSDRTRKKNSI